MKKQTSSRKLARANVWRMWSENEKCNIRESFYANLWRMSNKPYVALKLSFHVIHLIFGRACVKRFLQFCDQKLHHLKCKHLWTLENCFNCFFYGYNTLLMIYKLFLTLIFNNFSLDFLLKTQEIMWVFS